MTVTLVRLVRVIGFYFLASGLVFLFKPGALKHYVVFWTKGSRLFWVSAVRLLSGFVLLAAAPYVRGALFVAAFGVLNIAMGLPYFIRGIGGMKKAAGLWQKRPAVRARILGAVSLAAGVLLVICTL